MSTKRGPGRPKKAATRLRDGAFVKVRALGLEEEALRLTAELDGAPYDGRAKGPAVAPWLLEVGLKRARELAEAPEDASLADVVAALRVALKKDPLTSDK